MANQRIALIRMWSDPPFVKSTTQLLNEYFPEYEVDIIDIERLAKRRLDISLLNPFFVTKQYGLDILTKKRKYKNSYIRTAYFFQKVKEIISNQLSKKEYAFSFQLQSLIDASKPGLPHFVYTDHTHLANLDYPGFDRSQLFSPGWIQLENLIYQNATLVFTWSSNISRSLTEQYGCEPSKVICVRIGSNVQKMEHDPDDRRYAQKNILFVGVDWERKGGPELVEAFTIVLDTFPDAHMTIVGCSPEVNIPNCTVIGKVSLNQIGHFYENAAVFCLPTKIEPFGIVFIEALSYKLPVVATAIGAIPDFIFDQQNGYLVQPNDIEGLARALIDLIGDPEKCRAFGEYGYRLVEERYNWSKVGSTIREHIQPYLTENGVYTNRVAQTDKLELNE